MNANFPRVLTLLRKERGISQKLAASQLGISQALLSHYEKGIRECGLDFLCRCAEFYDVSCDYLLGRSPNRSGSMLTVSDIPEPDAMGRDQITKVGVLPLLNKKLIANSINVLFGLLARSNCKDLINEVSAFMMLAVYRMFRIVYQINPKNQNAMFTVPENMAQLYAQAAMTLHCANAVSIAQNTPAGELSCVPPAEVGALSITTESLEQDYPLFASSLLNLLQNAELEIPAPPKRDDDD